MTSLFILLAVFVGVAALVGGLAVLMRDRSSNKMEDRLELLTGQKKVPTAKDESIIRQGALTAEDAKKFADRFVSKFNLGLLFEQADVALTPTLFLGITAGLAAGGALLAWLFTNSTVTVVIALVGMGFMPLGYVAFKRKRRLKKFAGQLPDALELIARALRAGHSLGAGMNMVGSEMPAPIGPEFHQAFEEQNLGVPLEDSLTNLTERVPNLDLKFFATAVILQRQTGGDLAEILDKIGHLIRERFKIWGQVQALTGEGRLSGLVLLGLPPFLFLAVYYINPTYCMVLFEDPMGKQMLAFAVFLQILGALVIRKIVNIKV